MERRSVKPQAIHDVIDFVQREYPPENDFPRRETGQRDIGIGADWPLGDGFGRSPIPGWLRPGDGILVEPDATPTVDRSPIPQGPPLGSPDLLAYYLPFHFYRDTWGVYLLESGILEVTSMLLNVIGSGSVEALLQVAYRTLLDHERFHFCSEVACSRGEIVLSAALYPAYFHHFNATPLEEALANASAIRHSRRSQSGDVTLAIASWMRSLGYGYRDFDPWLTHRSFRTGLRHLSGVMIPQPLHSGGGPHGPAVPSRPTEYLYEGVLRSRPPTYLVQNVGIIGFLKPFPKYAGIRMVVHTNDHPPPHVHIEEVNGNDVTRLGWPSREPLSSDPPLSVVARRSVDRYLSRYGPEIDEKVRRVYGSIV